MVVVPLKDYPVETAKQIQPGVTREDVSQPYTEFAQNAERLGAAASDISTSMAKQAGLQAVSRDDQGNLVVQKGLFVGPAADAYHQAVKFSALAQGEAEAKRQDLLLSKQYHQDPEGYITQANAFRDKYVQEFTNKVGPDVGMALGRAIDNQTTYNYRWLLMEQQRNIKQNFDRDTKAVASRLDEDIFTGIQTSDPNKPIPPEIRAKIDERISVTKSRVTNPILGAPPEETKNELILFDQKVGAALFTSKVRQELQTKGLDAARDMIDNMTHDVSINPAQRIFNASFASTELNNFVKDQERAAVAQNKMQKDKDRLIENAIIQDSASPNPTVTENAIKTNPDMSPEAKMRMLAWKKREDLPEPLAQVSQVNAMELFQRMNLPDGDPQKITDMNPIRDRYINRGLTRADEDWLEKKFIEGRSPEGEQLNKIRQQFTAAVTPTIDRSNPLMGKIDQDGKMQVYAFERFIDQKVNEYRKAGKNPMDLFNPKNQDYLGGPGVLEPFQKPLAQSIRDIGRRLNQQPGASSVIPTPTPATKPQRLPNESPAAYLKRIGVE